MRIKINRNFTNNMEASKVKEDINEFNKRYVLEDLLYLVNNYFNLVMNKENLLKMNIEAFPAGTYFGDITCFHFEMFFHNYINMYRIIFAVDIDLNMISCNTIFKYKEEYHEDNILHA